MRNDRQRSPAVGTHGGTLELLGEGTLLEGGCKSRQPWQLSACSLSLLSIIEDVLPPLPALVDCCYAWIRQDSALPLNYKKKNEEKLARFVRNILKNLSRIIKNRSWKFIFLHLRIICSGKITI